MDQYIDPNLVRLNGPIKQEPPLSSRWRYVPRKGEKFFKGPIPLSWLEPVFGLPGKALHVAIRIWHLSGLKKSQSVKLNLSSFEKVGVSRDSARRGMRQLEDAGLITLVRQKGQAAIVTIILKSDQVSCQQGESYEK